MIVNQLCSLRFLQGINIYKKRSNSRLLGLSSQLSQWNAERISNKHAHGQSQNLSIEDVCSLKEIIHSAINKASVKCPEVFLDQMLFLAVGAIQVQSQTGSDRAWKLVNHSIQSHLHSQKDSRMMLAGIVTTAFVVYLSVMTMTNSQVKMNSFAQPISHQLQPSPVELITGVADPVTISTLQLAYHKMKSGTCQLPQAAMLQPEQRQAFLLFVNKGVIEVQHVENLRLALGYVNCLYPQELMHPPELMHATTRL
ncbi:MAG: hypothetical protein V4552_02250 [Pseudomonadota bacterium]